ncbi:MAG: Epoxyqueuosine reductase QueH [Eubacteriales bacterium SKADARSKE-1]|nr:Epoxyqueuosine reductase QueH [Eubacteriales bacterium SKADARSKE-1]
MQRDYQKELDLLIEKIKENKMKPALLLHSCCAPCSSYVLKYLLSFFNITVFYYNPNTFPEEEYNKRKFELEKLLSLMGVEKSVKLICSEYDHETFNRATKDFINEKEGGHRCSICYELRLQRTAELAKKLGVDYFCTTLSVSPYKNAQKLNNIGQKLAAEYGVNYLVSDFKKKAGYKQSIELSKKYNLYRQNYCGCKPPSA